jgi:hypothetical protein
VEESMVCRYIVKYTADNHRKNIRKTTVKACKRTEENESQKQINREKVLSERRM